MAVPKGCPNSLRNIQIYITSSITAHVSLCKRARTLFLQCAWSSPWLDILCSCTREDMLTYVSKSTPLVVTVRSSKLHILQQYTSAYIQRWPLKTHALYINKADKCMRYYVRYCRISSDMRPDDHKARYIVEKAPQSNVHVNYFY